MRVVLALLVGLSVVLCGGSCSDDDASGSKQPDADANANEAPCESWQLKDDGTCCPPATLYDFDSDSCLAVGPSVCAPDSGSTCMPVWCPAGTTLTAIGDDRSGGCLDAKVAKTHGCPAGMWRKTPGAPCVNAGIAGGSKTPAPKFIPDIAAAPGIASPKPLPSIVATPLCRDPKTGRARVCLVGEKGCGPGKMPDKSGGCITVGVPWVCPPGFDVHTDPKLKKLQCKASLWDCPPSKWRALDAGAVYVDTAAAPGGDGSKEKPYNDLAATLAGAASDTTIALAKGIYAGNFELDRPARLVGLCGRDTILVNKAAGYTITVDGKAPTGVVRIEYLQVRGDHGGIVVKGSIPTEVKRVWIHKPRRYGIASVAKAPVTLRNVHIDAIDPEGKFGGVGIAAFGAKVVLHDVGVDGASRYGIYVTTPGAQLIGELRGRWLEPSKVRCPVTASRPSPSTTASSNPAAS